MSNHFISFEAAKAMTTLFKANRESILRPDLQGQDILFISEKFDRDAFDALLGETGAEGLRFYLGMTDDLKVHIIAVATDAEGADILPDASNTSVLAGDAKILEYGQRCPPTCPPPGKGL